jgi:hypothetical protein
MFEIHSTVVNSLKLYELTRGLQLFHDKMLYQCIEEPKKLRRKIH